MYDTFIDLDAMLTNLLSNNKCLYLSLKLAIQTKIIDTVSEKYSVSNLTNKLSKIIVGKMMTRSVIIDHVRMINLKIKLTGRNLTSII